MLTTLTGNDSIIIDDIIFTDFASDDIGVLDYPDELVGLKIGKNGNTIYALNMSGMRNTLTIKLCAGSNNDKYLNSKINQFLNDPPSFVLIKGEFIKRVGDGQGNINNIIYKCAGGVIQKIPGAKENVSGDTESAVVQYVLVFANSPRGIV